MWSLDTFLSLGVLAIIAYFSLGDLIASIFRRGLPPAKRGRSRQSPPRVMRSDRSQLENSVNASAARSSAASLVQNVLPVQTAQEPARAETSNDMLVTVDELRRVAHAVELHTRGANEQKSIETSFECSKGAGAVWKRGKALFDAAKRGK